MEWTLEGGCSRAVVTAGGTPAGLARLAQALRCGVEIGGWENGPTGAGAPAWVWWGFVFGLRAVGLQLSLEELYNRVAVRYRDERPA